MATTIQRIKPFVALPLMLLFCGITVSASAEKGAVGGRAHNVSTCSNKTFEEYARNLETYYHGDKCNPDKYTQYDMNVCEHEAYKKANKELDDIYAQLMARLIKAELGQEVQEKLMQAQCAWMDYRDAQCVFNVQPGGSVYPMAYSVCMTMLTLQQKKILEQQLRCPDGDMTCVHTGYDLDHKK